MPRTLHHALSLALLAPTLLAATLLCGTASAQVSESVHVDGNVTHPLHLRVEDLRALPRQQMDDVRKVDGASAPTQRRYVGVRLRDLLARAEPTEPKRHDLRRSVVIVTATDGYQAVFSWSNCS